MHSRFFAALACCFFLMNAAAAAGASAPADAPAQAFLPDTVTPDGMHVGSWSAGAPASAPARPQAQASAPGRAAAPPAGPMTGTNANDGTSGAGDKVEASHSFVVTSIQSCYDQLDPSDVADIKKNYLKPYAECQARLEAKANSKKEFKAGEAARAATPETPRNYVRVQAPDPAPAAANSSGKSDTRTDP